MTTARPHSLSEATTAELRNVRGVCLDIDDTLSTQGKLTSEAGRGDFTARIALMPASLV